MFRFDWVYLRPALIVMSIALVLPIIIKLVGFNYYQTSVQQYELKNSEFDELNSRLVWVNEGQDMMKSFKSNFFELEKSGLFDDQQRVNWVDAINKARSAMKLPAVSYQVLPQRPHIVDYLQETEYVNVMSNAIILEAELLHEGDLVDLFGWMERYVPGQIHLSQCELTRKEAVFGYYSEDRPNMKAVCNFSWFTITPQQRLETNG